jgi:two-component system cell cycle response regulator
MGIVARSAIFVAFVFVLPLGGLALALEQGWVQQPVGALMGMVAMYGAFLVPLSRLYAQVVFLGRIRQINRVLGRMRLGDYEVSFPVGLERPDEDEMVRLVRNMNWVIHRIRHDMCTISRHAEKMRSMSLRDELTGLPNRRALELAFSEAACLEECVVVALMDCDGFKGVNDTHGHLVGDGVLVLLGHLLQEGVRANVDLPFRLGGDEFGVLFRRTTFTGAMDACRRIAFTFAQANSYGCTLSVGVVAAHLQYTTPLESILSQCDEALYHVKSKGKNDVFGLDLSLKNS